MHDISVLCCNNAWDTKENTVWHKLAQVWRKHDFGLIEAWIQYVDIITVEELDQAWQQSSCSNHSQTYYKSNLTEFTCSMMWSSFEESRTNCFLLLKNSRIICLSWTRNELSCPSFLCLNKQEGNITNLCFFAAAWANLGSDCWKQGGFLLIFYLKAEKLKQYEQEEGGNKKYCTSCCRSCAFLGHFFISDSVLYHTYSVLFSYHLMILVDQLLVDDFSMPWSLI